MKRIYAAIVLPVLLLIAAVPVQAQIWKKIKEQAKNAIDHAPPPPPRPGSRPAAADTPAAHSDNATAGATGATAAGTKGATTAGATAAGAQAKIPEASAVAGSAAYANYDFVAGDQIIFQPDMSGETNGEVPSHFTVSSGNAEMQTVDGQKVLHLDAGTGACVLPLMNSLHYLPDQFTVEFDMLFEGLQPTRFDPMMDFLVNFHVPEDENYNGYPRYSFRLAGVDRAYWGGQPFQSLPAALKTALSTPGVWHHVAIYLNKALGKVYIDQYRLAATNAVPRGAGHLAIRSNGKYGVFIKDVRIAQGGDDKYKKIVTEGKFVTHGILFDVNKATIKPESTGALKEIADLMKAHPDLQFEIDGHTDSDGKSDANMRLSQQRADAVKAALVEMGVDAGRLTTKGFGASKPMDTNGTAEGKANNRRVEFIRKGGSSAGGAGTAGSPAGRAGTAGHGTGSVQLESSGHGASRAITGGRPCCWIGNYLCTAPKETGAINILRKADGTVWSFRPGKALQQVAGLSDIVAVVTGSRHALGLKADGTVWAWGSNEDYQTGIDYTTGYIYTPVQVPGITGAIAISSYRSTSYALLNNGTIMAWGDARVGMAGDGGPLAGNMDATKNAIRKTPVKVQGIDNAIAISSAYALLADGTVVAWGDGANGRLGNGTTKSSPVPVKVSGITHAVAISCSDESGTAELADGSLWAWGYASTGMLGSGKDPLNGQDYSHQNVYSSVPVRVKGISHPVTFSANGNTAFALLAGGEVMGWGDARLGGMITKTTEYALTPMKLSGLHDVVAVQSGNMNGFALLKGGTVVGWGTDVVEKGDYHNSYVPVPVATLGSLAPRDCAVR